ncbi:hypothetical protein DFH07DRAFT_966972 [Mycena maculata]|uniref:Uncharacterized protein n=1 Tax=Mycena maculata TaxID=230809 RepID=A0AAD7MWQ8_9AGAR|nr:hypothetical protein DFH07DRAFT_966972 [Mycena maculata]
MSRAKEHGETVLQLAIAAQDIRVQALAMLKETRNLSREGSDVLNKIMSTRQELYYLLALGDYGRAAVAGDQVVVLLHALGLDSSSFLYRGVITLLGEVCFARTEYEAARKINEPLATSSQNLKGSVSNVVGYALHNLALADIYMGAYDVTGILENLGATRSIFVDTSDDYGIDQCNIARMELHMIHGEYKNAKAISFATVALPGKSGDILASCFERLGDIACAEQDFTVAFRYYVVLLAVTQKYEDMRETTMALRHLGNIFLVQGDEDAALDMWNGALEAFTWMDIHRGRAECMLRIEDVHVQRRDVVSANGLWTSARELFKRCSQANQIQACDKRLLGS